MPIIVSKRESLLKLVHSVQHITFLATGYNLGKIRERFFKCHPLTSPYLIVKTVLFWRAGLEACLDGGWGWVAVLCRRDFFSTWYFIFPQISCPSTKHFFFSLIIPSGTETYVWSISDISISWGYTVVEKYFHVFKAALETVYRDS